MRNLLLIALLILIFTSCTENAKQQKVEDNIEQSTKKAKFQSKIDLSQPKAGMVIKRGKAVFLELKITEDKRQIDSLVYFVNNKRIQTPKDSIFTNSFRSGSNTISVKSYNNDGSTNHVSTYVMVISDIIPEQHKVKMINKYPHDVTAYTQGLIYTNDFLYEGTGQFRESMLKKINLEKNELIQSYNLPKEVFGEGIVEHDNKIYQITWQSKRAFVYDLKTFNLIHEFQYDTEGWGITNYFENLIMSDGTQYLYILDPESFAVMDQLQVTDNIGPINNLNELEWINGKIWANVYLTNTIVIIDPETGFVEQKLDLTNLVPDTYANAHDNVLNGIAHDKETNKIYVTGKRWPVLYEIEVTK